MKVYFEIIHTTSNSDILAIALVDEDGDHNLEDSRWRNFDITYSAIVLESHAPWCN